MKAKDLYLCFKRGASDGFNLRPLNPTNANHKLEAIQAAYHSGYKSGWEQARRLSEAAEAYSGHKSLRIETLREE